jgi:energy-coupling factor transport system ATP-binding protein
MSEVSRAEATAPAIITATTLATATTTAASTAVAMETTTTTESSMEIATAAARETATVATATVVTPYTPFLKLDHVCFSYPRGARVIQDVSLTIYKEDFTVIKGKNGSGKTTLGKLMTGILKPNAGFAEIDGDKTTELSLGQIGKRIGYLFQNPSCQLFAPTVYEEMAFILKLKGMPEKEIQEKTEKLLDYFELQDVRNNNTFKLSGGEKQRLAIAAILINDPEFLILDEPTKGFDYERKKKLSQLLKKLHGDGIGILVISHDEEFNKEHQTREILLTGGEVAYDSRNSDNRP